LSLDKFMGFSVYLFDFQLQIHEKFLDLIWQNRLTLIMYQIQRIDY